MSKEMEEGAKPMKNYYEILEVNPKASKEVIEKAYRVLAKKYHPDLYTGDKQRYAEKKIKEINEAYNVLSDDFLREQYDNEIYNENRVEAQGEVRTRPNVRRNYYEEQERQETMEQPAKVYKVGTFGSLFQLTKELIQNLFNKEKRKEMKKMTQTDALAIGLTIVVILVIGIILWFLPFTNGWMRELLFENPLFNWIGGLFS